jgi:hypothetical protein
MPMTDVHELKAALLGRWASIAPEVRPSRSPDGTIKPFYLLRDFVYLAEDRFELAVTNFADALGRVPIARIDLGGHMSWRGEHAIALGAQKVDFVADAVYGVTPLAQGFADLLNEIATDGYARWQLGGRQEVLGKSFAPFGLVKGESFKEYDLVHLAHGLLFWGARHVDGRGFDSEANRPANLQIPLVRA